MKSPAPTAVARNANHKHNVYFILMAAGVEGINFGLSVISNRQYIYIYIVL